jgi:hypothetical protein
LTPVTPRDLVTLLVIGGGVWLLIQFSGLKIWHAVLVLVAGFYLALSAVGPQVHRFLSRIPGLFGH